MRLSTDEDRDEARARATILAALEASISVFDTARAYGDNERLLGETIAGPARIVTKCGMRRTDGLWIPDGRATAIAEDLRASRAALGGLGVDLLLLHAPDPKTSIKTSVRALARAREEGQVRAIGLSNVNLRELEEARRITTISAVEVALGAFDDAAARGGLVRYCATHGIELFAHSPFGGPTRAGRLAKNPLLKELARALGITPVQVFLAYLLHVHPAITPLVGARRPESIQGAVLATAVELDRGALDRLDQRFPGLARLRVPPPVPSATHGEIVMLMGIAGAGKSTAAQRYVSRGYLRLNRDTLGGTLRGVVRALEAELERGERNFVLDNTYVSRASRNDIVMVAQRHGVAVRCVFVNTPIHEAQINVVSRMLDKYGALLEPDQMRTKAKKDPSLVAPTALFRMLRELEPPASDEGFAAIETIEFERLPSASAERAGAAIAWDLVVNESDGRLELRSRAAELVRSNTTDAPALLFAWRPAAAPAWRERAEQLAIELSNQSGRALELAICAHPAGPPTCWCRPPLPGLWLAFAARHRVDSRRSIVIGASQAHRTMARAIGASVVDLDADVLSRV